MATRSRAHHWLRRVGAALLAGLCALAPATASATEPPNGKIVAEVIPQGNRITSTQAIVGMLRTRSGDPYDHTTVLADVKRLTELNAFSDVQVQAQDLPDGRVRLFINVAEVRGTIQEVVYAGNKHLKLDELRTLTGLRIGVPLNPQANYAACQAIRQKYIESGRLHANVELVEGQNYTDQRVVFNITEGPIVKLTSVQFVGQEAVSGERLRTQTTASRAILGMIGGDYNPNQVEFDKQKLEEYYRNMGYQDVKIRQEITWKDARTVGLTYHINEGVQYRVKKVQIEGNVTFPEAQLLTHTRLKPGGIYDKNVSQADVSFLRDFYGLYGRAVGVRESVFQSGPGEVAVHYQVEERPPARVGNVYIIGNDVTRDNVIRRQVPLYPGQVLSYPDLRIGENNLAKIGLFDVKPDQGIRPTITVLDPDGESEVKDLMVQVQEAPTGSFMLGLGVNSDAGLSGSIVLNERNFDIMRPPLSFEDILAGRAFRGAGQEFRLEAVPGTQFQRYTASFREPFLFDSPYSLGLSGYYYTRAFNEYTETRLGGRVSVDRRFGPLWKGSASVRLETVDAFGISVYAPDSIYEDRGRHTLLGFRAGVNRDSRDSYLRPTEGSVLDLGFEQVTGDYDFPIFTAEYSKFFTTYQRKDGSGRHVLSMRSQLSVVGSQAPVFERLYAGGFRSIRGFEFRGVGPFEPGIAYGSGMFNVGGRMSFLNSFEYQIPLLANDQIYAVSFLDTGSVEKNLEIKDYRVTAGFGLRLVVPALGPVPIALDFGFPLRKGPNDREQLFSFWMGFFN